MKVKIIDDETFILYIKKETFKYKEDKEELIEEIFDYLEKYYNIESSGFYFINLYKNDYYGMILEVNNVGEDFYSYKLNVELQVIETDFYIEIDTPQKNSIIIDEKIYKKIDNIKDYESGEILYDLKGKGKMVDI
ncbi:MAG: hypothetical protein RR500_00140 [Bacilli bacterium]